MNDFTIMKMIESMEADTQDLKYEFYRLIWGMRGGITSQDIYHLLSHEDRKILLQIIEENIDISKKNGISLM